MSWTSASSRSTCSSIWRRRVTLTVSSWRPQSSRVSALTLMAASGVFSSCEALATKSCRIRSSRRSSVTSWKTRTAPDGGWPASGVPWTETTRACSAESGSRPGTVNSAPIGAAAGEGRLDGDPDLGAPDQVGQQVPVGLVVEPEEPLGRRVGEDEPLAGVDGQDALGHAAEHGVELAAVVLEPADPASEAADRLVDPRRLGPARARPTGPGPAGPRPPGRSPRPLRRAARVPVGSAAGRSPPGWPPRSPPPPGPPARIPSIAPRDRPDQGRPPMVGPPLAPVS